MGLQEVRRHWEALGKADPLYGVLSDPAKRGGAWDTQEFFATGEAEITALFTQAASRAAAFKDGTALDFGCGVGRLSQALAKRFEKVVAVDVAPSMLEAAKGFDQSSGKVQWVLNQAPDLCFQADATVDLVYSHIVLQHLPPALAKGYIAEFIRVLSPQGWAVFQIPVEAQDQAWRRGLKRWVPKGLLAAYRRWRYGAGALAEVEVEMNGIPAADVLEVVDKAGGTAQALPGGWYWAQRKVQDAPR